MQADSLPAEPQEKPFVYLRNPEKASVPEAWERKEKAEGQSRQRALWAMVRRSAFLPRAARIYQWAYQTADSQPLGGKEKRWSFSGKGKAVKRENKS